MGAPGVPVAGRGGRAPNPLAMPPQGQAPRSMNMPQAPRPGVPMGNPAARTSDHSTPLTSDMLGKANPSQQKQMIGERIFPRIQAREPKLAGKITGMLLEMDNMELLHLLEDQQALTGKINEALMVLNQHAQNKISEE